MPAPKDPRIDTYLENAAPFAQPILRHLRKLVRAASPDLVETIKWGAPSFTYHDRLVCTFAAFKQHAAFVFHHQGMEKLLEAKIGKSGEAMGHLGRLKSLADLPSDKVLASYLARALQLCDAGVPARAKTKPRPVPPMPAIFAAALQRNRKAATEWQQFTPSAQREYLEWIIEAKRPETQEKRIETTLEWVAEGKNRNWKYQNC